MIQKYQLDSRLCFASASVMSMSLEKVVTLSMKLWMSYSLVLKQSSRVWVVTTLRKQRFRSSESQRSWVFLILSIFVTDTRVRVVLIPYWISSNRFFKINWTKATQVWLKMSQRWNEEWRVHSGKFEGLLCILFIVAFRSMVTICTWIQRCRNFINLCMKTTHRTSLNYLYNLFESTLKCTLTCTFWAMRLRSWPKVCWTKAL